MDLLNHRFDFDWFAIFLLLLLNLEYLLAFAAIAFAFDPVPQQIVTVDQQVNRQQGVLAQVIDHG